MLLCTCYVQGETSYGNSLFVLLFPMLAHAGGVCIQKTKGPRSFASPISARLATNLGRMGPAKLLGLGLVVLC